MAKNTETLPKLPAGSIDFNKVHSACKQGRTDPFKDAVTHSRDPAAEVTDQQKAAKKTVAEEAGLVVDEETGALVQPGEDA